MSKPDQEKVRVDRLTDRLDMTTVVNWGVQQNSNKQITSIVS